MSNPNPMQTPNGFNPNNPGYPAPGNATAPSQWQGAPAQPGGYDYFQNQPTPPKKNRGLLITLILLCVVLLTLIGLIIYFLSVGGNTQKPAATGTGVTEVQSDNGSSQGEDATGDGKQADGKDGSDGQSDKFNYPPTGEVEKRKEVLAPSSNIWCRLSGDEVRCTIKENNYLQNNLENCGPDTPVSFVVNEKETTLVCSSEVPFTSNKMEYGHTAVNGNVACNITSQGMNCWNMKSGKAVFISRDIWNDEPKHRNS